MKRSQKPKQEPCRADILDLALTHVDTLLERIRLRKLKAFEPSLIQQLQKLTAPELKKLNHFFQRSYEDIQAALDGDDFFIEAYPQYDKGQMKIALQLYKKLRTLKHDDSATGRFSSGPRKHKEKPPEQIVKKVLFLEKDAETGVSSLKPTELVGAAKLWVYNVKTRKLGAYIAKSGGLTAKGTTVLNYDEKQSTTKTLRKPKAQLTEFISKSPSDMQKFWDGIRAVPQEITPRMSRDTLILRAIESA